MRVLFLADQFADSSRDEFSRYPGGAELTDQAVIQGSPWTVERKVIREADEGTFQDYDLLLLGNLARATKQQRRAIAKLGRHVLFEHDYRMCRFRGDNSLTCEPAHRWFDRCVCLQSKWGDVFDSSHGAIFLSQRQLAAYNANPWIRVPNSRVLGCSVFGEEFFEFAEQALAEPGAERDLEAVVVYSVHRIKGYAHALAHCRAHGIYPHVIRDVAPREVWNVLRRAKQLVFFPQWLEPASRLAVEARFLGCEVVSNHRIGVMGEPWWSVPNQVALSFVKTAAARFWCFVAELSGRNT